MEKACLALILIACFLLFGCASQAQSDSSSNSPLVNCINACKQALKDGKSLENGPCLLNPDPQNKDWVCDVAHEPRIDVDNDPANQCSAYREAKASNFVEVTTDCKFIRSG